MMSMTARRSLGSGVSPGKTLSCWHQYLDECPPDRGRNPRCFNGLPYRCEFPQIKIVCQQKRGIPFTICGREIVNAVLIVGGVAFEKAAHTASHSARTAPERHAPASARAANDREPRSPLRAYWSVYELTHRASGSRRAAGSSSTRTECPRLCWHTNFICGNPQRYGKPLKQRGCLPRSSGHSSRYWCQQDSVFARSGCLCATI